MGSTCTGAALLAEAGLLDGRTATTHSALAGDLAVGHPEVRLDPDRIFVHDQVWTSAGVTAGIDLALEIVRRHHGTAMAAQRATDGTVLDLLAHIADHPGSDLSVNALADQVGMAPRSFQRLFSREVGTSAGAYVERVRIEAARRLLERTDDGIARVARQCGYRTVETFHRSFRRLTGVTPGQYRERFRGQSSQEMPKVKARNCPSRRRSDGEAPTWLSRDPAARRHRRASGWGAAPASRPAAS